MYDSYILLLIHWDIVELSPNSVIDFESIFPNNLATILFCGDILACQPTMLGKDFGNKCIIKAIDKKSEVFVTFIAFKISSNFHFQK